MDSNPFLIKNPNTKSVVSTNKPSGGNPFMVHKTQVTGEPSPHQLYTSDGIPMGDPVHIPRDAPVTKETKPEIPVSNLRGKQEDTTLLDDFINFIKPNKNLVNEVDQFTDQLQGGKQLKELGIGLVEGGSEMVRTLNTAIDKATGGRTDFGGAAERTLPNFPEPKGIANTMARSIGQWAPGMAIGGGAMQSLLATSKLAPLAKTVLTSMAADAGGGFLSANPNDQPLIIGDKSMLSSYTGWGVNPETGVVEDKDLFSKKLTLAMDATLTGLGVGAVFGLLGKVFGDLAPLPQVKNIARMGSKSMQEDSAMRKLIEGFGGDITDPNSIERIIQTVASSTDIDIKLSQNHKLLADVAYKQPTFRIFLNKWAEDAALANPKQAAQIRKEIAKINNLVNAQAGDAMEAAMNAPVVALNQTTDQMVKNVGGGIDNIQSSGPRIEKAFQEQMLGPKAAELATQEEKLANIPRQIDRQFRENPVIGPMVQESDRVAIDTSKASLDQANKIATDFTNVIGGVTTTKNMHYNKIPKGTIGNTDIVINKINEINEKFGANIIPDNLIKRVEATGGDIAKLDEIASLNLSDLINSKVKLGNINEANALRELKRTMTTDQLDGIIAKYNATREAVSDPIYALDAVDELDLSVVKDLEAAQWALDAKKFFMDDVVPLRNHPTTSKIRDLQIDYNKTQNIDVVPEARDLIVSDIDNVTNRPERIFGSQEGPGLIQLYDKYITTGNGKQEFKKYGLLRVAEKIYDSVIPKGSFSENDIIMIRNAFKEIYPFLDGAEKESVESLLTKIRDTAIIEKVDLEKLIGGLKAELRGIEDDIYGNILETFFQNNRALKGNSYASLKQMFSKSGNENNLEKIMNVVGQSGDEEALRAIQGAYGKYLKDSFFTASDSRSGVPSVSIDKISEFLDETGSMANYTKQLYGVDFYNNMKLIVQDIKNNFGVIGRKQEGLVPITEIQSLGAQSVNSVITWLLGVLNPTAARVRTVTGLYMKNNPTMPQIKEIVDGLLSNPEYFVQVANRVKSQAKSAKVRKEVGQYVRSLLTKSAIYGPQENEQFNPTDEQTNEVFQPLEININEKDVQNAQK